MAQEKFSSINELYMRVLPALKLKRKELIVNKLPFITEKDIWDCLIENKWKNMANLTLFDIVNTILEVKEEELLDFMNKDIEKGE